MVRGFALAETTPGPLDEQENTARKSPRWHPGAMDPWVAAVLASLLVALWAGLGAFLIDTYTY